MSNACRRCARLSPWCRRLDLRTRSQPCEYAAELASEVRLSGWVWFHESLKWRCLMGERLLPVVGVALGVLCLVAADWPQWRGPERNGISQETGLLKEWPKG